MSRTKRASEGKGSRKALTVLSVAGMSLAATTNGAVAEISPQGPAPLHAAPLYEEEIFDVSLATFHLFDRERAGANDPLLKYAHGGCGGCGGCHGCGGGGGCHGCGGGGGCHGCAGGMHGCAGGIHGCGGMHGCAVPRLPRLRRRMRMGRMVGRMRRMRLVSVVGRVQPLVLKRSPSGRPLRDGEASSIR